MLQKSKYAIIPSEVLLVAYHTNTNLLAILKLNFRVSIAIEI